MSDHIRQPAAVVDCACGQDHNTMPTDPDVRELVCRIHKRHKPCRPCRRLRKR